MPALPKNKPCPVGAEADAGQGIAPGAAGEAAPGACGLSATLSDAIRVMRLPLLIGPLLVHACLAPERSPLQFILARVLGDISVPAFFFISGLLFFATYDGTARRYGRKLQSRVRSLVIPYLLWNLIGYFVLAYAVPMVAKCDFWRSFWAVRVARREVASAPVDGPLYFIKGIVFLAIAAPAFHFALRRKWLAWFAPAAALCWLLSPVPALANRMFVVAVAMFSLGGFVFFHRLDIVEGLVRPGREAAWALAAFLVASAANVALHLAGVDATAVRRLNILFGIPAWFAAAGCLARGALAPTLRRAQGFAMFLFCSFDLIMAASRKHWHALRDMGDAMCVKVALGTFAASLAAYLLLSVVARPLLRLLVGNRR